MYEIDKSVVVVSALFWIR